uniref:Peptidase S26 domain-containing protein n=1 Tax=Chromera velia CCMP2878 TaxID=1169474 RepID=A0A0G4GRW4_9ALVE|mmetsp:Transcript_49604/g.97735  ORF Transcript_49604/g.97735 Transcript_49604/m.97735 type:complete len:559 (-) Transcript_49604:54-1730(-)|eukprot:Cvel_23127.t1-p1 / transcript=Cvel_23127.t1 / gene=Cvel_23127 / organism=Chromera_velia_CCMP2878 / gene_product=Mitochondrial inner membrane protease subunit 2, putative / transcript_product=Mitochondrial inner membrane protease subunit 2, putative / location=Cvel_scaffold2349:12403-15500(-) / protein_length=558 / sequence_SO=supercontig / SO=protein_coding / is_pseudo=false
MPTSTPLRFVLKTVGLIGSLHVVHEYLFDFATAVGPSMIPLLSGSGDIVLLDRFSHRFTLISEVSREALRSRLARLGHFFRCLSVRQTAAVTESAESRRERGEGEDDWEEDRDKDRESVLHRAHKEALEGMMRATGYRRGDVVIAESPEDSAVRVCKRVIALPGEVVRYNPLLFNQTGRAHLQALRQSRLVYAEAHPNTDTETETKGAVDAETECSLCRCLCPSSSFPSHPDPPSSPSSFPPAASPTTQTDPPEEESLWPSSDPGGSAFLRQSETQRGREGAVVQGREGRDDLQDCSCFPTSDGVCSVTGAEKHSTEGESDSTAENQPFVFGSLRFPFCVFPFSFLGCSPLSPFGGLCKFRDPASCETHATPQDPPLTQAPESSYSSPASSQSQPGAAAVSAAPLPPSAASASVPLSGGGEIEIQVEGEEDEDSGARWIAFSRRRAAPSPSPSSSSSSSSADSERGWGGGGAHRLRKVCTCPRLRVPPHHLWLQGDNMGASHDSRHYGPVPEALVLGKVRYRVWPPNRMRRFDNSTPPHLLGALSVEHEGPCFPSAYR